MNKFSIQTYAKLTPIEIINNEFLLAKCYIQGIGKNNNMTYMSKESVLKNLGTLSYCPVVGHLIQKEDGSYVMGGHDYYITDDWCFKTLTVPYGVVIPDSFEFEIINEYGKPAEYLTGQCILWVGRYPELKEAMYDENIYFAQSMEINVHKTRYLEEDSNFTELLEWTYSALCMLGKSDDPEFNIEPCFDNAKIVPFESNSKYSQMMEELNNKLSFYFDKKPKEGGTSVLKLTEEQIQAILDKYSLTKADLNFEISEKMTEELLSFKINEFIKDKEISAIKGQFEEMKGKYEAAEDELTQLREFKADYEAKQHKAEVDAVLAEFEELKNIDEFKALSKRATELEVADLKEKCFAIHGRHNFAKSKKVDPTTIKIPIDPPEDPLQEPYGGLFSKYGNIN